MRASEGKVLHHEVVTKGLRWRSFMWPSVVWRLVIASFLAYSALTGGARPLLAQDLCGIGIESCNELAVMITDNRTGVTYTGFGYLVQFNAYTTSNEYTFTAGTDGGLGGQWISGTFDINMADMETGVNSGVFDLTNIVIDGGWSDGGTYLDSPPEDDPVYYGILRADERFFAFVNYCPIPSLELITGGIA